MTARLTLLKTPTARVAGEEPPRRGLTAALWVALAVLFAAFILIWRYLL